MGNGGIIGWGGGWQIESEVGLSALVIEPVAREAVVGQDRPDLVLKVDFLGIAFFRIGVRLLVGKRCVCPANPQNCYDEDSFAHHPRMR